MVGDIFAILAALAAPLANLIEAAFADDYDADAERQAMLNFQRAIFDERLKRRLASPR